MHSAGQRSEPTPLSLRAWASILAWPLFLAGWMPLGVFLVHLVSWRLGLYERWPPLDVPMHLAGGFAIAWFWNLSLALPPGSDRLWRGRPGRFRAAVVALSAAAAVLWELAELALDGIFGTRAVLGWGDSLLDLAMGLLGACILVTISTRMGTPGPGPWERDLAGRLTRMLQAALITVIAVALAVAAGGAALLVSRSWWVGGALLLGGAAVTIKCVPLLRLAGKMTHEVEAIFRRTGRRPPTEP